MHHRQNFWYNLLVKAITETFFQYVVCKQGRDGVRDKVKGEDSVLWWEVTSNRRVRFKILGMSGESPILTLYSKRS